VSAPLDLPGHDPDADFVRAELQFHGVDHSGLSYEARIFLNRPDADAESERQGSDETAGYAGSFHIFGHGGCFGDVGHCDVPSEPRSAQDLRLTHPLTPDTKVVIITEALKRLRAEGAASVTVTVVAHVYDPGELPVGRDLAEPLLFDDVRLVTYESPPAGPAPAHG
jgi:tyrosinase